MKHIYKLLLLFLSLSMTTCKQSPSPQTHEMIESKTAKTNWKTEVKAVLERYGHRNWIVVADAAYPEQSNPAIQTVVIDATQLEAVNFVNTMIGEAEHVESNIYLDRELEYVSEDLAGGVGTYRSELHQVLQGQPVTTLLHEDIISKLDEAANLFKVLIVKTNMTIPYTSVFFQLECGYWPSDSEQTLREAIENNPD